MQLFQLHLEDRKCYFVLLKRHLNMMNTLNRCGPMDKICNSNSAAAL